MGADRRGQGKRRGAIGGVGGKKSGQETREGDKTGRDERKRGVAEGRAKVGSERGRTGKGRRSVIFVVITTVSI